MLVSVTQYSDPAVHIHVFILFQILSHVSYHRHIRRAACALWQILVGYLLYMKRSVFVSESQAPDLSPAHVSPVVSISLLSVFVGLFYKYICVIF